MMLAQGILKAAVSASAMALCVGTASAVIELQPPVTVTAQINSFGSLSEFVYTVTNNSGFSEINAFEIPELRLGDLFASISDGPTPSSAFNFTFSESTTSSLFAQGDGLYRGRPGAYLYFFGGSIAAGDSATFSLFSTRTGTTNAKFIFSLPSFESSFLVDPPIPGTQGVPEPASWALMIAGFGLVGAGMRRRKVTVTYA
jgi:PEP-CTERM motif